MDGTRPACIAAESAATSDHSTAMCDRQRLSLPVSQPASQSAGDAVDDLSASIRHTTDVNGRTHRELRPPSVSTPPSPTHTQHRTRSSPICTALHNYEQKPPSSNTIPFLASLAMLLRAEVVVYIATVSMPKNSFLSSLHS